MNLDYQLGDLREAISGLKIDPQKVRNKFLSQVDKARKDAPGEKKGLLNLGNTCYMNSLMQILFHTELFKRTLMLCDQHDQLAYLSPVFQLQNFFA